MNTVYSASNRTIHYWAIGGMSDLGMYITFTLILPIFTTGFGLKPYLVSWALVLPRLIDGLLDPILGHFSDNLRTRWGRRRPLIFITAIIGAAATIGLWWPSREWNEYAIFAYLLAASILLYTVWGVFNMSHSAMGYELSDDYHIRTKIIAIRSLYSAIVSSLLGGWVYWLALRPVFGNEITGIRCVAVGWAALILISGLIPALTCTERVQEMNRTHVSLRSALWAVLRNRPMFMYVLFRICQTFGIVLYSHMSFFIMTYSVCRGDKSLATSLNGYTGWMGFAFTLLITPLALQLSRRLGKRNAILLGAGASVLGAVIMPFVLLPGHPYLPLVYAFFFIPASIISALFLGAVVPDICDIDELEHGECRQGLISAVLQFISKVEISICVLIAGYLLTSTGFDAQLKQQPQEVLDRMRFLAFAPQIVFSIVCFIIALQFPFTEQMMAEVRRRLDERKPLQAVQSPANGTNPQLNIL